MNRSSGILMSVSSLPSKYGIGTFGKAAYQFADFLHAAGQKYWQMLPLGPTSFGDSPYQSFSSFAGNPYFIDLDMLIDEGLISKKDVESINFGTNPRYVDYGKIYENRFEVLRRAKKAGWERDNKEVNIFISNNAWVSDYALFMACKNYFEMKPWLEWDDEKLKAREPETLEKYRKELKEDMEFFAYIQYLFYKQWNALRDYLHSLGIKTIGDMPIYVPLDSADVWSEPDMFMLDENFFPENVAGVPPDYFSEDGQLWGNPLYNWEKMQQDGFGWWIRRIAGATKMFDMIRIDHFRGFSEYWAVPYGDKTAVNGHWMKGPGMSLVRALSGWFHGTEFIAEDLGTPSDALSELLKNSGWPGMRVLEFAFVDGEDSNYLPHNYEKNCICYTGTHDNATLLEWMDELDKKDFIWATEYLGLTGHVAELTEKKPGTKSQDIRKKLAWSIICAGQSSSANLFIAQMQDYMELGKNHRMNVPGTVTKNWQWRLLPEELTKELADKIKKLTKLYFRIDKTDIDE